MSIQGGLEISLTQHSGSHNHLSCEILSSRPLRACELFAGKTIKYTLSTVPLIFSICSKAQTVTVIRAIESAVYSPASNKTESTREALVCLESLREQVLRILMDWPGYIGEQSGSAHLAFVAMGIDQLMQSLEPKGVLSFPAKEFSLRSHHRQAWECFSRQLGDILFSAKSDQWLKGVLLVGDTKRGCSVQSWSESQLTQSARFMHWLSHQEWKNAGSSAVRHLPKIDDQDLARRLSSNHEQFTSAPRWNGQSYELSWFSRQQTRPNSVVTALSKSLSSQHGNGIYVRMVARLLEVASLLAQLDSYFIQGHQLKAPVSTQQGLAHSNAARGKLTHYVQVEDSIIDRFIILAPTEWNFHPQGVAADSLTQLQPDTRQGVGALTKQAELLIHAIDPCVGYQLRVGIDETQTGVLH